MSDFLTDIHPEELPEYQDFDLWQDYSKGENHDKN